MLRWLRAAVVIVSWMTVLPVPLHTAVDRDGARRAITLLPLAGALIGGLCALGAWAATALGATPLLAAALVTLAGAALTRGMHLDGLADTVDALASYAEPDRAREIMRDGPVGPLGAAAIVLVSIVECAALAAIISAHGWWAIVAIGVVSRAVTVVLCRRGQGAAPGGGFGPLVADSQGPVALGWAALCALATAAAAGYRLGGVSAAGIVAALVAALGAAMPLWGAHITRRIGGVSGDVLGATIAGVAAAAATGFALIAN